jgi:hypothetical protein
LPDRAAPPKGGAQVIACAQPAARAVDSRAMKPCYVTIEIQEPIEPSTYLQIRARADARQRLISLPKWVAARWELPLAWRVGPEPLYPLVTTRVRCLDRQATLHAHFMQDECVLGVDALTALDLLVLPSEGLVVGNPRRRATLP